MTMALVFCEIHPAPTADALNEEWFVVENTGKIPVTTKGVAMTRAKGKGRGTAIGTLDPGFTLQPGEKIRLITGIASKKAHGAPPAETDELKNYHLFLKGAVLQGPGTTLRLALKQIEFGVGTFDPAAPGGVAG
jgi:hypothetical protein